MKNNDTNNLAMKMIILTIMANEIEVRLDEPYNYITNIILNIVLYSLDITNDNQMTIR